MHTPANKPTNDNRSAWHTYWIHQGQDWRTEPEIAAERQASLAKRRIMVPDIAQGIYPFKDITPKLTRADIEWLLATHEDGRGPIDVKDETQRNRRGLDLRGADLSGTAAAPFDLQRLPLAQTQFGLSIGYVYITGAEAAKAAGANLQSANLSKATLQSATLYEANLQSADLSRANLQSANLSGATLQSANLSGATLQNADLSKATLQSANLSEATLQNADLSRANLQSANLIWANLQSTDLSGAEMQSANLSGAKLQSADLSRANLQSANLSGATLQSATLYKANLQSANLSRATLQNANLSGATLQNADLRAIICDSQTHLDTVTLNAHITVADATWGGVNLVNIDWSPVSALGDETFARQPRLTNNTSKTHLTCLGEYRAAVRAYRLLATALRNQGMNEEADHFAYRAQVCQRAVLRFQRRWGQYLWSGVLDVIAGYGYRPARSFLAYLLIIFSFSILYFFLGQANHPLTPEEAFVVSMTAFHGRGFFGNQFQPGDPQALAAAFEAFIGLMIEVSFIATFTQRYFGK